MNSLLKGKKIVILGIANKWSIAWGIAESLYKAGATLAFTYIPAVEKNVRKLAEEFEGAICLQCDVAKDEEIEGLFQSLQEVWGSVDGIIHSVAFAKKEELDGLYTETSREGYLLAQEISAYSLVAVSKYARPLMPEGGSITTLTYLGGERVIPNYNVMGVAKAALEASVKYLAADLGQFNIRVNAISAGPIKTLATRGIKDFDKMLKMAEDRAPMKKLTEIEEVGDTALFLCSDLARGITGENIHVDCGYHILGM